MREITTHKVNACNEAITVEALDGPGPGGANHKYKVDIPTSCSGFEPITLDFQYGVIDRRGGNGITNEVLLAIVADRLEGFQSGHYACVENGGALHYIHAAMQRLNDRTNARVERGVEGAMKV